MSKRRDVSVDSECRGKGNREIGEWVREISVLNHG